jgi:excisionase family DNA binding protein
LSSAEKLSRKKVFTTFEVAEICDVTPVTIQNWIDKGWLRAYRTPGGHRRVRKEALLAFLESRNIPHPFPERRGVPTVLIVNGDQSLADSLREALLSGEPGYEIQVARDGFRAGVLYSTSHPDVVILDLNHSSVDGYEVCRQIKQSEAGGETVVLAFDGGDGEGRRRILDMGAAHCLPKPVDAVSLRNLVKEAVLNRWRSP